jgi:hypothetical protein
MRHRPTGGAPGRPPGFGLVYVYRCRGLSSGGILFGPHRRRASLASRQRFRARPRRSHSDGDPRHRRCHPDHRHSPATGQTARAPVEIDRSFQISMRKEVLRAAALTTFKLPFSHCIFDRWRVRNRPAVGKWRWAMGNDSRQKRFAGCTGPSGWRYNFEENSAVDPLQKQRRLITDTIHD